MTQLIAATIIAVSAGACYLILRRLAESNRNYPLSERACLTLLRACAWRYAVGAAWDAGILRYRMERELTDIEMKSTTARLSGSVPLGVDNA